MNDDLSNLAHKLESLPQNIQTKVAKVVLKEALAETNARAELQSYISSHFRTITGIYKKSVSSVKVTRVRSDHNRVISYIYFRPINETKRTKKSGQAVKHIQPRTLTHWFNAGTRDHKVGKGSRLKSREGMQQLTENKYQIAISTARLNLLRAKTDKQRQKYQGIMDRQIKKLADVRARGRRALTQHGSAVRGISAHRFMEAIQRRVDAQTGDIVIRGLTQAIFDLLK